MLRRVLVVLAAAFTALVALRADAARPSRIERAPEFVQRVDEAIGRGVAWIKANPDGSGGFAEYGGYRYGLDALVYHTLRVCGVPKDDPVAAQAWTSLRKSWASSGGRSALQTYTAGLMLMAIAEHGERISDPLDDREVLLEKADRAWAEEIVRWLVQAQNDDGTWTYGAQGGAYRRRGAANVHDHSNTQYAMLGLKAAARCGIEIESRVWRASLRHFLDVQESSGRDVIRFEPDAEKPSDKGATSAARGRDKARGWGYVGRDTAYGSMTAGGVASVVICRSELMGTPAMSKSIEAESETSIRDGLAWLGRNFTVRTNPGPAGTMAGFGWHYYYLYAVERAGVLAGVDWMADRDWYGEGATFLCDAQNADGGWLAGDGLAEGRRARPRVMRTAASAQTFLDTCFALLFLKKGTIPVRRGALTQAADDTDIRFEAAATLSGRDLEDLVDLVLSRWRRATDEDVQRRLFEGATSVGPRIVEPLLVRMDSSDAEHRSAAYALLKHATGVDLAFEPRSDPTTREASLVKWQAWWLAASKSLRYDAATKRLVTR